MCDLAHFYVISDHGPPPSVLVTTPTSKYVSDPAHLQEHKSSWYCLARLRLHN